MRTLLWASLAACMLPGGPGAARAGEKEEIAALVDAAMAARGGEEKLKGLKAAVWKSEGSWAGRSTKGTLAGQVPGQFRLESNRTQNGRTTRFVRIINGDKGWVVENGKARPMTRDEMAATRLTFYQKHLDATLVPLRDKDTRLSLLGDGRVEGKAVVGLKVSREGLPDVRLYFDKQTKLLVKSERETKNKETGKAAVLELRYSDYEDVDGVKMARRTRRFVDSKMVANIRITEFQLKKSLDEALFLPPSGGAESNKP